LPVQESVTICKIVLAAANRVVHRVHSCHKIPLTIVLHCNIYPPLKIFVKFCSYL